MDEVEVGGPMTGTGSIFGKVSDRKERRQMPSAHERKNSIFCTIDRGSTGRERSPVV